MKLKYYLQKLGIKLPEKKNIAFEIVNSFIERKELDKTILAYECKGYNQAIKEIENIEIPDPFSLKNMPIIYGEYQCEHAKNGFLSTDCVWCALTVAEKGLKSLKSKLENKNDI